MTLPALLVLTDRRQSPRPLVETVTEVVQAGGRAVVLREKDLPAGERAALAEALRTVLHQVDGLLILAGPDGEAVHLAAADALPGTRPRLVGRSCHDAAEVDRARREGCDYVTVSPVFATPSKPGYGPPLGTPGLERLCADDPPAYALGGIRPEHVADCIAAGARGVAVMGPLMRDPRLTADYLDALREDPA